MRRVVQSLWRQATPPMVRFVTTQQARVHTPRLLGGFAVAAVAGGGLFVMAAHKPALAESTEGSKSEAAKEGFVMKGMRMVGFSNWVDWAVEPAERAGCPPGKLLPDPPALPPGVVQRTLVLSLEDCIIHTEWDRKRGHRTKKRPGLDAFLAHMSQFYEIVIFTTALASYGQRITMDLQDTGYVQHALFRENCKYTGGKFVKDLSYLNRDLRHVIIVDNNPDSYANQPHNAIHIKDWSDDMEDTALLELIPFLEAVFREDISDVREVLSKIPSGSVPEKFRELKHKQLESRKKNILGSARASPAAVPVLSTLVPHKAPALHLPTVKTAEPKKEGKKDEAPAEGAGDDKSVQQVKKVHALFDKAKGLHH